MRTTIDIPDGIYRALKSKAADEGKSVKELVLSGVFVALQPEAKATRNRRLKLPMFRSDKPGTLKLENEMIYDLIGFP